MSGDELEIYCAPLMAVLGVSHKQELLCKCAKGTCKHDSHWKQIIKQTYTGSDQPAGKDSNIH